MAAYSVRKNVTLLSVCQGLSNVSVTMVISVSALTAYMLLENKSLATLPHAMMWSTTMVTSPLAATLFHRAGRRTGFIVGALIGILGALVAGYGALIGYFWIFNSGIMLLGAFNSFAMFYRFAASEAADEAFRAKAIALVIGGGVIAAFVGGELADQTYNLLPVQFSGTLFAVAVVPTLMILTLLFIDFRPEPKMQETGPVRPMAEIARDPRFGVAVLGGAVSWAGMVLIMTATPLSMKLCGYQFRPDVTGVIQWHIFAMFAPSFFSGWLIGRFGVLNVMLAGVALFAASIVVAVSGNAVANYWIMNFLIGVGWNLMFVGATELLAQCHTPAERNKVQGVNDFIVFASVAAASFLSGYVHHIAGWNAVNYINIAGVVAVSVGVFRLSRVMRQQSVAAE